MVVDEMAIWIRFSKYFRHHGGLNCTSTIPSANHMGPFLPFRPTTALIFTKLSVGSRTFWKCRALAIRVF